MLAGWAVVHLLRYVPVDGRHLGTFRQQNMLASPLVDDHSSAGDNGCSSLPYSRSHIVNTDLDSWFRIPEKIILTLNP